ncbi:PREDICTED: uncharacterized protein LOC105566744 [Vollenhovia emeryi]|uniref:uncharacterized protein LOC105566744 n=1 Tax=Vollenhovia emeryi TaxID=411798 RepID=UPI0005F3DEF5|nr:PREDICTED: uncharacterized protein LOC105566744 [Vollenhovia emeryi]
MMRMQAASNITLRNMEKRLAKIEDAIKQRTRSPDAINDNLIAPFLPLSSITAIKEFDAFLKTSNEAVIQFKEFMSKTGGHNGKDNIHRILNKTITNECAIQCSWKGLRNNFRISDLHLIKIMKREVTLRYAMFTETEFDAITSEWIRFANQRSKRAKAKETVNEDNEAN